MLGSGHDDTWSLTPGSTRVRGGRRGAVVDALEEEDDSQEGSRRDSETSRRSAEDACAAAEEPHHYDSVVQLLGEASAPVCGDGVRVMVSRHEALHSTPWYTK